MLYNDYKRHDALGVDGVVDAHADPGGAIGDKKEGFHPFEYGAEGVETSFCLEMRSDFIENFLYHNLYCCRWLDDIRESGTRMLPQRPYGLPDAVWWKPLCIFFSQQVETFADDALQL
jgi:hypothetical protein